MHKVSILLLLLISMPTLVFAVGNEPVDLLPDSNTATFRTDSRNYWKQELPAILGRYFSADWVFSGGLHGLSATCTSSAFSTEAFTLPTTVDGRSERVRAKSDGTGGTAAINYSLVGANCSNPGSDVARVAACSISGDSTGNWQRSTGSNYFVNAVDTAPAIPAGCAGLMDVIITNGAVSARTNIARHSPIEADTGLINVQDFGADPDDSGDDTAAIQAAIATIPPGTAFSTTKGSGCLYFPLPRTQTGFYKVSSTLDFSNRWNSCMIAPALITQGQSVVDGERGALIKWYGAINTDVVLLNDLISMRLENISVDCRSIAGTVGIALGPRLDQTSIVKLVQAHHVEVSYCDIGIRHGDFAANGPDVASNTFNDVYLHDNVSAGFAQYSGNGLVNGSNWLMEHNGYAPTVATHGGAGAVLQQGVQVFAEGGSLSLSNYASVGDPAPTIADIYASSAGIVLNNAWIETHTVAVKTDGNPIRASEITALLHYNASMTNVNTPTSIQWQSANPLVISGQLFGDIDVQAGQSTVVTDKGVKFIINGQQSGRIPVFKGTAILNQHAYAGFPTDAQRARVTLGRPPRTDIGSTASNAPAVEMTGLEQRTLEAWCTTNVTEEGCLTLSVQRGGTNGVGRVHIIGNGYFDATGIKSQSSGRMSYFTTSGGDSTLGQPVFAVETDLATGANQLKFAGGVDHKNVVGVRYTVIGTGTNPVLKVGNQSIGWATAPPTLGAWLIGDVIYNNTPIAGQPKGWRCTVSGTPGTWVSEGNL